MNDFEDRIRHTLDAQAKAVRAEPEPEDLTDRIARRERRRTRGLSVALVLALFAGPVLGFVIGRGDGDEPDRVASDEADADSDDAGSPESTTVPPLGFGSTGAGTSGALLDAWGSSRAAGVYPALSGLPLERAFVRDVDGIKIRAYRAPLTPFADDGPSWAAPPGWCYPNGIVQADVSTDDAVGIVTGGVFAELRDGKVAATLGAIGVEEGAAVWVVVAQAPEGAATVRASFPGGASDEMEPVDGAVVLAAPGAIEPDADLTQARVPVEAFDADGSSLGSIEVRYGQFYGEFEDFPAECSAQPPLPPAGAEQPADPEAARAAVGAALATAYNGASTVAERQTAIDDPTWSERAGELATGPYAQQVSDATAVMTEAVFLSATRAAVRYDINIENYTNFAGRLGEVVLVDGAWKLTRETVCNDIALAGVSCK